jgi:putative serine protease PepD
VLIALQADHWITDRKANEPVILGSRPTAMPVSMQTAGPVDFRMSAKKVLPSVVSVDRFDRPNLFSETNAVQETGSGSGVILTDDGIIVTNNHVVANAAEVQVRLANKKSYRAKVLGTDRRFDLAVLKIEAKGLTPIEIGQSKSLDVGQWVIAVGNPLGLDQTVSVGVVSSLGRTVEVPGSPMTDAIQTDAAINPGNSGGALCDTDGHLVGINSAIASIPSNYSGGQSGSIGIGFAIPVERVKSVVGQIVKKGYATSAGLGFKYDQRWIGILQFDQARMQMQDITGAEPPNYGIIVGEIQPGGAAEKAGMKTWDVILQIDDTKVDAPIALNQVLNSKEPGQKVSVKFWTKGQTKTVNVALTEVRDE